MCCLAFSYQQVFRSRNHGWTIGSGGGAWGVSCRFVLEDPVELSLCIFNNGPRGWRNVEFTYTVTKQIKAPVLNPPPLYPPPQIQYVLPTLPCFSWKELYYITGYSAATAPSPTFSMLIELVDWPAPCQPPMHLTSTLSLPSGHRTQETSLNTTHIRTCTRPSNSTRSSSRLSLTLASRLLANKEKPLVISSSLWSVQRTVFIILSGKNSVRCHCLWLWFEFWLQSDGFWWKKTAVGREICAWWAFCAFRRYWTTETLYEIDTG